MLSRLLPLQWVHGPRTVVIAAGGLATVWPKVSFNGSTVREPWLSGRPAPLSEAWTGFNGSTVREPWL